MIAVAQKQKKKQSFVRWGAPSSEEGVDLSDYNAMVKQAEQGKGVSFEEYTQKTQTWLKKNL